ncbi:cell division initiation protein [Desulfosarcina sp. BuS5]|uniref:DivIVA domain-containing protein n=1 Tax=Desulfosarcina sp. BuS5 TaxID=933262 RepID=UPI00048210B4|nr:DivIVA domain-containing protein [Desulfosarcina sp. BuS5]WDN87442.1 cell division initiation protein [Desulfosarcina sp. BuS5]
MKTTPIDIQQQQFKVKFRGFDIHAVDSFLEEMADTFEVMQHQIENLNDKIHRLKLENQGYKEREDTFKRAILNSQEVLEQIKDNANKSAEIIIADAEVKAEKILNRAHNRLSQLHEDITELKRQRMQIEVQIRSIIETHTKLLDMGKEETKILDDVDSKVKLLKHTDQF